MTFDLFFGLHMQFQTWHPPLWLCTHAKYYVKSGLTNVLKNANKTKNMHLFWIGIANYKTATLKRPKIGFHDKLLLSAVQSMPGRVAQAVTCLATDACLTADPGVGSSIRVRSHTFVLIDHEIISTVILLPSADLFKKSCCQLQGKVCARITG